MLNEQVAMAEQQKSELVVASTSEGFPWSTWLAWGFGAACGRLIGRALDSTEGPRRVRLYAGMAVGKGWESTMDLHQRHPGTPRGGSRLALGLVLALVPATSGRAAGTEQETKLDCGVNALFLLLQIEGRPVTWDRLEAALPARHPDGYSMASSPTPRYWLGRLSGLLLEQRAEQGHGHHRRLYPTHAAGHQSGDAVARRSGDPCLASLPTASNRSRFVLGFMVLPRRVIVGGRPTSPYRSGKKIGRIGVTEGRRMAPHEDGRDGR